ncbi:MAG: cyclic nucleotide-binding domain-containing protein [Thermoanaerobaculales bacterium]
MAPMAHIEMMVFLQGVNLFAHCNADQVLRLAAIAREHTFEKNEVIFHRNDPADGLYCVVESQASSRGVRRQKAASPTSSANPEL